MNDEAKAMSKIIIGKKSVLVTSATHMDRSLQLFHKYGSKPIPAPANYLAKDRLGETPSYYYIPSAYYLYKTRVVWHEYIGKFQNYLKAF